MGSRDRAARLTRLTPAELARISGIEIAALRVWAKEGALKSFGTPARPLFNRLDVVEFLRARTRIVPPRLDAPPRVVALSCTRPEVTRAIAAMDRVASHRYEDVALAISALAATDAEAFVVDVTTLPAKTMPQLVRRLRSSPPTQHVRVVALADTDASLAEVMAAGAAAFVAGYDTLEIRLVLERALALG
jgi:glycerol-3-phosphate O-acyltransferase